MSGQLDILFSKIKALEDELIEELQKQQEEFSFEIEKRRISFRRKHRSSP